jgi:two-component system chemotaxis sensor kinase CheA
VQDSDDLIDAFIEEAREHLPIIEASLLALEHKPNDQETINLLFRGVHTIKGGAGFLGLRSIGDLTHSMESLLTLVRANKLQLTTKHIDVLLMGSDCLASMIDDSLNSNIVDVKALCQSLDELITRPEAQAPAVAEPPKTEPNKLYPTESIEITAQPPAFKNLSTLKDSASDDDLVVGFIEESRECVPLIERCLLALEADPSDMQQLNELFRHVHTIKGGASFLGLEKIQP